MTDSNLQNEELPRKQYSCEFFYLKATAYTRDILLLSATISFLCKNKLKDYNSTPKSDPPLALSTDLTQFCL